MVRYNTENISVPMGILQATVSNKSSFQFLGNLLLDHSLYNNLLRPHFHQLGAFARLFFFFGSSANKNNQMLIHNQEISTKNLGSFLLKQQFFVSDSP